MMAKSIVLALAVAVASAARPDPALAQNGRGGRQEEMTASAQRSLVDQYCIPCHNQRLKTGGLTLDGVDTLQVSRNPALWEKVVKKLRGGTMPPSGRPRPDTETMAAFVGSVEA